MALSSILYRHHIEGKMTEAMAMLEAETAKKQLEEREKKSHTNSFSPYVTTPFSPYITTPFSHKSTEDEMGEREKKSHEPFSPICHNPFLPIWHTPISHRRSWPRRSRNAPRRYTTPYPPLGLLRRTPTLCWSPNPHPDSHPDPPPPPPPPGREGGGERHARGGVLATAPHGGVFSFIQPIFPICHNPIFPIYHPNLFTRCVFLSLTPISSYVTTSFSSYISPTLPFLQHSSPTPTKTQAFPVDECEAADAAEAAELFPQGAKVCFLPLNPLFPYVAPFSPYTTGIFF